MCISRNKYNRHFDCNHMEFPCDCRRAQKLVFMGSVVMALGMRIHYFIIKFDQCHGWGTSSQDDIEDYFSWPFFIQFSTHEIHMYSLCIRAISHAYQNRGEKINNKKLILF